MNNFHFFFLYISMGKFFLWKMWIYIHFYSYFHFMGQWECVVVFSRRWISSACCTFEFFIFNTIFILCFDKSILKFAPLTQRVEKAYFRVNKLKSALGWNQLHFSAHCLLNWDKMLTSYKLFFSNSISSIRISSRRSEVAFQFVFWIF